MAAKPKIYLDGRPRQKGYLDHYHRGIGIYCKNIVEKLVLKIPNINLLYDPYYAGPFFDLKSKNIILREINFGSRNLLLRKLRISSGLQLNKLNGLHVFFSHFDIPLNLKVPFIATIPDLLFLEKELINIRYRVKSFFWKLFINRAYKIITISNYSKQKIIERWGVEDKKIEVIYLGTQMKKQRKNNKKYPDKYFLYVGALDKRKNFESILNSFMEIQKDFHDINLYIVGKIFKDFSYLNNQKILNNHPNIKIFGYVEDQVLNELYSNAEALVYSSKMEGFGLPVLEAMSSGCPVLCEQETSIPEVGGDAPCYVDFSNQIEVIKNLKKILTDRKFTENLIKKGLNQSKKFSWDLSADKFQIIINNYFSELRGAI